MQEKQCDCMNICKSRQKFSYTYLFNYLIKGYLHCKYSCMAVIKYIYNFLVGE